MPEDVPRQPLVVTLGLTVPAALDVIVNSERFEFREAVEEPVRVVTKLVDRFEDEGRVLRELPFRFPRPNGRHRFRRSDPDMLGQDGLGRVAPRWTDEGARLERAIVGTLVPVERSDRGRRERKDSLENRLVELERGGHRSRRTSSER